MVAAGIPDGIRPSPQTAILSITPQYYFGQTRQSLDFVAMMLMLNLVPPLAHSASSLVPL